MKTALPTGASHFAVSNKTGERVPVIVITGRGGKELWAVSGGPNGWPHRLSDDEFTLVQNVWREWLACAVVFGFWLLAMGAYYGAGEWL